MKLSAIDLSFLEALRPLLPLPLWQQAAPGTAGLVLIRAAYVYLGWRPFEDATAGQKQQAAQQQIIPRR